MYKIILYQKECEILINEHIFCHFRLRFDGGPVWNFINNWFAEDVSLTYLFFYLKLSFKKFQIFIFEF